MRTWRVECYEYHLHTVPIYLSLNLRGHEFTPCANNTDPTIGKLAVNDGGRSGCWRRKVAVFPYRIFPSQQE